MYKRLQYISQGSTAEQQYKNIEAALHAGCRWVQLRYKRAPTEELEELARSVRKMCDAKRATFIVNDDAALAAYVNADGVHVGLDDISVSEARRILGPGKIIGGTANTLEHVLQRVSEQCNYIGLGPFRFTTTKEKLSPVLGATGYATIMQQLKEKGHSTPVYAIGGIQAEDVQSIMRTGVYGVAVSGVITNMENKQQTVEQLNTFLYEGI